MNLSNKSYTRSEQTLAAEKQCQMRKKLASKQLAEALADIPPEIAERASSRVSLDAKYRNGLAGKYALAAATLRYARL